MDNSFQITEYPLHEAVFSGNLKELSQLLKANKNLIDEKDFHGNTPLHLATMMGRFDCVCLLLSHNATVNIKNGTGWSVLAEAISFGNRPMIELLLKKLKKQSREQMKKRRPQLIAALTTVNDFYLELRWEFSSWIPLVSKILPGDVCKIYKLGSSIRLDSTLIDFNDMHWQRGDISFIFRGDKENDESIVVMDNESKVFQVVRTQESDAEMQDEIDLLMQSDILTASMSTKSITFQKAQAGWFFREDKKETIAGQYKCEIFNINGLVLEQRKRREHLNLDDLQKNKTSIVESLTKSSQAVETSNTEVRRSSLKPPPSKNVTWLEYISAERGQYPNLGRDQVFKKSYKHFKANVAMSKDFPLTIDILLNVFEVIAPFKHFSKLRDFFLFKLPPGFPIKIDIPIPIAPTISAKITFQDFEFRDNLTPELFEVPKHYTEDSTRFPDL